MADNSENQWFEAASKSLNQDTATVIRNNLVNTSGINPDQAAQYKRIATATNIPLPTVQAMPDLARQRAAQQSLDAQELARRFPNTAQFLTNPDNMALAHDDIPATAQVEQHVAALGRPALPPDTPVLSAGPAPSYRERLTGWLRDLVGLPPAGRDEAASARAWLDLTAQRMGTTRQGLRQVVGGMSPIPQQFGQGFFDSFTAGLAPDATGAPDSTSGGVARGAGSLAGFMLGLPLKVASAAVGGVGGTRLAPAAGDAFIKVLGKDVTRSAATLGLASGLSTTGQALNSNTPGGVASEYAQATGSGAAMGAVFGAAGRIFPDNTVPQAIARAVGVNATLDAMQGTRPWDDRPLEQKVFDYGLNTVFSLHGAGRTGGGWLYDAARADTAAHDGQILSGLAEASANSKLRARDPDAFKSFVANASEDGPVPAVFVDGEQLANALHQSGVKPAQFRELMPDAAKQLDEAVATGGQVRIPVEDFATHIAGGPLQEPLMPHLRTDPEGMTLAEADTFRQSHIESLRADAQRLAEAKAADDPWQKSRQQVHDEILRQLNDANRFTPDVNKAYAALHRDFYSTMAERTGMLPHEFFEKYPVNISASDITAGAHLEQSTTLDALEKKWEDAGIKSALSEKNGVITLHKIIVPEGERSKGKGTAAMQALVDYADATGQHIALSPSADFGGNKKRLAEFYKRFGFIENKGKNRAFSTSESMYRQAEGKVLHQSVIPDGVAIEQKDGSDFVSAKSNAGLVGGHVRDGALHITTAEVEAAERGKGEGIKLYQTLVDHALERGLKVFSDSTVEADAVRMYEALRRRGYDVQRLPGGELEDGAVYGADATHPAFEVVAKPAIEDKALLQDARGVFDPASKTIGLLKSADLSTFLHETGHFFLDTLADIAARPDAPDALKADLQTAFNWMGVKDAEDWHGRTLEQQRSAHEQFARGFEAYLMEGKAPSLETASLFQRFRTWLAQVYKSLKTLNVELTPEVRGVFDRLLASGDAIKQAETARGMTALFRDPADAEKHGIDYQAYQKLGAEATESAVSELAGKTIRDMAWLDNVRSKALRGVEKDAAEKRKAIRAEVEREVDDMPVYAAQRFLKRGEVRNGDELIQAAEGHRLSISDLQEMYPEGELAGGPDWRKLGYGKYGMLAEKGLHPDLVADMFGYSSGHELVRALLEADPRRETVQGMTDQRMLERHGEISDPQAMARMADSLVHNEVRTRFIATELNALNKAVGPVRDLAKAAKEVAQAAIDGRRVRDINVGMFTRSEATAAKEAERKLMGGDTAGAAEAKRNQLLNNQLARAAMDAKDTIDKGLKYLAKFDKASVREGIDLEYRDQIDALLDRYDLRKSVSGSALDKREALLSFVERMSAQGYEPQIPEKLLDEAQRTHYKDLSFGEFKGLLDAVKSIEHLGKLKDRLLDLQASRKLADLATEATQTTAKMPQHTPDSNRGLTRMETAWVNAKAAGRSLEASLLKMEQMFDWLDARNPNGVFNRVVFRRIADAGIKENDMLAKVKAGMDTLAEAHLADVTKERGKIYTADNLIDGLTGKPQKFTKKQLLMLAGNMGNESNAAKLAAGENWSISAVWDFLNANMSKADWDFVAGLGKSLESLWPEKLAMSRRLGNTNPEKIEPRPFSTPHGDYEGWYWPMIYDPARAQDVAERGAKQGDALFENTYSRANTDTGRMNTRNANYARPLLLDLDAIPRVIKDEIHDIAFREAVIDADKFLSDKRVRDAIVGALSQQHYDQLRPWLQSIANDGRSSTENMRALKWFSDLANGARTRATIVGLGYRISTMMVHGMSAGLESVAELGPKWMASGLKDFSNPAQWAANRDFIFERSGEMRNRMNEVDRDIREHLREIDIRMMDPTSSAIQRGADIMKAHAYQGIAMLDMASALPTWMGAYKKGMTPIERGGLGMSEADAVYFADKTVRNAHGGTGVKDMAAVQRGPEFFKLFTMFYTFWNHNVNRLLDTAKLVTSAEHRAVMKEANHWSDSEVAATVIMRTLIYTLGIQVMHGIFHPPKEGEGEDSWVKWAGKEFASAAFSGIPVLRDLSAHYLSGKDYSATPAAAMVDAFGRSGQDAANALTGEQVSDKWLKHTITTAGYVFGLPTGQPASAAQFLWDVAADKQHPQDAADWWRGILHGTMTKH